MKAKKFLVPAILLIATLIIVFVNMVISPQYEMVYSQYNQSIYYLIGKMMKSGKTLYVDMIDHKGVYIFLLHYLAEVICETNHIGLYIIGSAFIFVTSLYIYKLLMLLSANNFKLISYNNFIAVLLSMLSITLQTLYTTTSGTLQCETFILTALLISIYYFCKSIVNDEFNLKTTLLYGILFSFVVFIKANYALVYLYFAIYILMRLLKNKNTNAVAEHFIYGIFGVFIGMLPGILYCIYKGNMKEMIYNAFAMNMLYSNIPYFGKSSRLESILYALNAFKIHFGTLVVGFIVSFRIDRALNNNKTKCLKNLFVITLIIIFAILYSARDYKYYLLVLIPSFIVILYYILELLGAIFSKLNNKIVVAILNTICILLLIVSITIINLNFGKVLMIENGKKQLKIAKEIKSVYMEDNTFVINAKNNIFDFFVLGTNLYIYDYMGMLPKFKYFCIPMISYSYYSKPYTETYDYINSGRAKYVVVGNGYILQELFKKTNIVKALNDNYSSLSFNGGISALVRKNRN